jgi:hypothetical protein
MWAPAYAKSDDQGPKPTLARGGFTLGSSPGIEPARNRLHFGYKGDHGWYDKSRDDDYADQALRQFLPRLTYGVSHTRAFVALEHAEARQPE